MKNIRQEYRTGLSPDVAPRELFEKEGLAGFVGLILRLADERIRCKDNQQIIATHGDGVCSDIERCFIARFN